MPPTARAALSKKLKAGNDKAKADQAPLWAGPCGEGPQGGITQSLLGRYLSCPERFRVHTVLGLHPAPTFSAPMEFGNMWHVCEEGFAKNGHWVGPLDEYVSALMGKYQLERDKVAHWHGMAKALFPRYAAHWQKHPDVKARTPLMQEQPFDVPYRLPSGHVVRLRGKFDSVDLIDGGVYLQENKTKSGIDGNKIARQLRFDLQTMMYLIALEQHVKCRITQVKNVKDDRTFWGANPIIGVRYNVVRRPAHKTVDSALKKLDEDERNGRIGEWFARWKVEISTTDVEAFKRTCLNPVLENLCDDYEWWVRCAANGIDVWDAKRRQESKVSPGYKRHFRLPYGIYSPVHEGGFGDVDNYLESGSTVGLRRAETLFPELETADA